MMADVRKEVEVESIVLELGVPEQVVEEVLAVLQQDVVMALNGGVGELKTAVVVEVQAEHFQERVVLGLEMLEVGERVQTAYAKLVEALAASFRLEVVVSASCLYWRLLTMVSSPMHREEG